AVIEKDIKGIAIDEGYCFSQVSKLEKINYPNFKYIPNKCIKSKDDGSSKNVAFIKIINLPDNFIREMAVTINDIVENKDYSVANAINEIIDYFKKVKFTKKVENELIGDMGEALFILECVNRGINCNDFVRENDNDLYDFKINNKVIEVKTTSPNKNEFNISYEQLTMIKDKSIVICKFKKVIGHSTILDIYNKIAEKGTLPNLLIEKYKEWENVANNSENAGLADLVKEYSVIESKVQLSLMKEKRLPIIDIIELNSCKKITFAINCTDSDLLPIDSIFN
ncbi:MAG: PD-(D/E)XK motif protein, partial [Mycoplasma sp.]